MSARSGAEPVSRLDPTGVAARVILIVFGAAAAALTALVCDRLFLSIVPRLEGGWVSEHSSLLTSAWVAALLLAIAAGVMASAVAGGRRPSWLTPVAAAAVMLLPVPGGSLASRWIVYSVTGVPAATCEGALQKVGNVYLIDSSLPGGVGATVLYAGRELQSRCGPAHSVLASSGLV